MDEEKLESESARRDAEIRQFLEEFPGVKPEEIGADVWEDVRRGESLTGAYRQGQARRLRDENRQLRAKLAAEETNRRNRERSLGSQQTSGRDQGRDAFLEALLG